MAEEVKYVLTLKDLLTPKLVNANTEAKKLEGTMRGLGNAIALAFSGAAIAAFGAKVIQAGTTVENARIGLTTLLGDANEAAGVIKNTMQDATQTPFSFEGLLSGNQALISAGINSKKARQDVLMLGNAISATGGTQVEFDRMVSNLQQIKNVGEANARDIKEFGYAKINMFTLLDAAGIKHGDGEVLTYEKITEALRVAHDKGGIYFNGLENMANATSVKISNLGDAFFQLNVKIFNYFKPAIDATVNALTNAVKWVGENKDLLIALGAGVATLAAGYLLYNTYLAYNNALVLINTARTFLSLVATDGLAKSLYAAGVAGTAMWAALTLGLSLVVVGLVLAYQKSETFRAVLSGIGAVAGALGSIFASLGKIVMGVFTLSPTMLLSGAQDLANAAGSIQGAYAKGYAQSMQASSGSGSTLSTMFGMGGETTKEKIKPGTGGKSLGTPAANVGNSKPTTINITINKLVETLKISATTVSDSASKVKDEMTKAIVSAITDATVISGQ